VDAANDLALLKANAEGGMKNEETFKPLPIAASRTVALGGTVATVGFPDIGLQGVKKTNDEGRMKNEETKRQLARVNWDFFIHPSSFFISPGRCRRM